MNKMRSTIISFIVVGLLLASLTVFLYHKDKQGVYRELSVSSIGQGGIFTLSLDVRMGQDKTYYVIEEDVPKGFKIIGENFTDNKIKIIKFPKAINHIYSYKIRAPNQSGRYAFTGKYAMGKMKQAVAIRGDSIINIGR